MYVLGSFKGWYYFLFVACSKMLYFSFFTKIVTFFLVCWSNDLARAWPLSIWKKIRAWQLYQKGIQIAQDNITSTGTLPNKFSSFSPMPIKQKIANYSSCTSFFIKWQHAEIIRAITSQNHQVQFWKILSSLE